MDPDPDSLLHIAFTVGGFFSLFGANLLIILLLLILSALVSGSEVAYFSLSATEIEEFKVKGGRVWRLLKRPRELLATILIFNNLVNVGIILLSTFTLSEMAAIYGWNGGSTGIILKIVEVGAITFLLLFFGEITPKVYASQRRQQIVRFMALSMNSLRILFYPLSFLLINSTSFIDKRLRIESDAASFEDIKHAIDLTSEDESPESEKDILKGIVEFSNIAVKAIMRARVDVIAIEQDTSFDEVVELINEYGYSRIPVYEESLDKIKGVLYVKDLLRRLKDKKDNPQWLDLIRQAYFIPESKKIDDLLEEFKTKRLHIAIVVDEFGGTSGIVTLEDIIEEIFGEINDEFDPEEMYFSKLSDTTFVFDGKVALHDLVKITDLPDTIFDETKGEADSLAGLVLEVHGKIPLKGDVIEHENFRFHIESVTKSRIKRIKFEILELDTENGAAPTD